MLKTNPYFTRIGLRFRIMIITDTLIIIIFNNITYSRVPQAIELISSAHLRKGFLFKYHDTYLMLLPIFNCIQFIPSKFFMLYLFLY